MVNRFKRRSVLILFFSIQFILLSSYTFLHYQNETKDDESHIPESSLSIVYDDIGLPADSIEKSNRSNLNGNYRDPKLSKTQLKENLPIVGELQSLNVSFVTDTAEEKTIVQCSLLPTHLGESLMNFSRMIYV